MRDELTDGGDFFVFREVLDSAFAVDFFLMEDDFPAEELFEDMRERTLVIFPSVVLVFLGVGLFISTFLWMPGSAVFDEGE